MADPIVLTESLGGSPLSRAARAGQLPQWYRVPPRPEQWADYVADVRSSASPRWYDDLAPAIAATGGAADRLRRSADGKGVVITTGQQPGLFGGPLMSFIKALAARGLADVLQETLGVPVAPIFWAATDDADFEEASVVSVQLDGGARELKLQRRGPSGTPMAYTPMDGAELATLSALLREASGSAPHAAYLDAALRAYRGGATVGDAYVALLRELLEPLEIPVLDSSHPAVVRAEAQMLLQAAQQAPTLAKAVHARCDEIRAAGFVPQVDEVADLSLVFTNVAGMKRRLTIREATAFASLPEGHHLSTTVLVRPVVERAMLPTAAYLGGPGEVAYFAQVSAVANALGVSTPLVLPRWSATIVEPRIQKMLNDLGADVAALADPHAIEGRIARRAAPPDALDAIAAARLSLRLNAEALERATDKLMPAAAIEGMRRSVEHRLQRTERRLLAAVKRHEEDDMRKIATARGSLFPHGARQERKLAFVPFLARYGPALIESMLAAARTHARMLIGGSPALSSTSASTPATV